MLSLKTKDFKAHPKLKNRKSDNTVQHNNEKTAVDFPDLGKVRYILVESFEEGQRLDNFLMTRLKGVPKTCIYRIVRKGEVRVNKGRVKSQYRLQAGDSIRIPPLRMSSSASLEISSSFTEASEDPNSSMQSPMIHLSRSHTSNKLCGAVPNDLKSSVLSSIIYEDDALLVLNKPSGLAAHGGSGLSFGAIELLRELKPKCRFLELVHRLDRDTSGCMLFAKDRKTLLSLQNQLKEGSTEKVYWALVKGRWRGGESIEVPLKKNQLSSGERIVKVHPQGQWAKTEFKILERYPLATLLEVKPITGRTHQIRVHAAYCGNPVAGDTKYGDENFDREMKSFGLKRLFLHAKSITFNLPNTTQRISFEAPLSEALLEVQKRLSEGASQKASEVSKVTKTFKEPKVFKASKTPKDSKASNASKEILKKLPIRGKVRGKANERQH